MILMSFVMAETQPRDGSATFDPENGRLGHETPRAVSAILFRHQVVERGP